MSSFVGVAGIPALAWGSAIPWSVVIGASIAAAVIDGRVRRVPNALTGPLLLAGILWSLCGTLGAFGPIGGAGTAKGVGDSILGALVAALPFIVLWLAAGRGAGDAKLMLGIGAWLGVSGGVLVLVCIALAGGVLALGWALAEGRLLATLAGVPRAAVDLVFLLRGPGRVQDRRDLVFASAPTAEAAVAAPQGPAVIAAVVPKRKIWLPYATAICAGTCAAALRVFFS